MRSIYIGLVCQQCMARRFGSRSAAKETMRIGLVVLVIIVLGALYYWQHHEQAPPRESAGPVTTQTPLSQPTQSPQNSQVNWMKRSIDRAQDLARKARAQTTEGQDP
jgi:hypothetical protein